MAPSQLPTTQPAYWFLLRSRSGAAKCVGDKHCLQPKEPPNSQAGTESQYPGMPTHTDLSSFRGQAWAQCRRLLQPVQAGREADLNESWDSRLNQWFQYKFGPIAANQVL